MQTLKNIFALMLVIALSACGGGLVGDVDESHPTQQAPKNTPQFVLAYNEKNQLIVNWDHHNDVQFYTLYLSTSENFETSETSLISLDQPPYIIKPENTGQQYYVKLKSSWFGNESAESVQQTFTAPPFVPNEFVSTVTEENTVKLNWATVEGAEGYTVYRQTNDELDINNAVVIENVSPPYEDNTLLPNQDYYYWIVSTASDQPSAFSIVSAVKTSVLVDENQPPVFKSDNTFNINENNLKISILLAEDDLTEDLSFNIIGGDDASLFSLISDSGELVFNTAPDYEAPDDNDSNNIYQLEVEASDGEITTQQMIEITVLDLDDTLPVTPETLPEVNFTLTNIDATESDDTVTLSLILDKANALNPISIDVNTLAGTASPNDYLAMSNQQLIIPAGDTQQSIEVKIIDDELYEGSISESFTISLSNAVGATLGNQSSVVININDNDPQPTTQPTANAGLDRSVPVNTLITLDGTASKTFDGSGNLNYLWAPPTGISLSAIGVVQPTFTLPVGSKAGSVFSFTLTVSNSDNINSEPDTVDFIVINSNPVANAGLDQSARVGDVVTLDASESTDPNNDNLSYEWLAPTGISLSNTTDPKPTFTVAAGTEAGTSFVFKLTTSDNQGGSNIDEVTITIFDTVPTADAGPDQSASVDELITLDASASTDPNSDNLKYLWTPPSGVTLSSVSVEKPTFTVPNGYKSGATLVFSVTVTVTDTQGSTNTDNVKITILNSSPTANAGANQTAHVNDVITLDASESTDPNLDTLSYSWSVPAGINFSDTKSQQPTFTVPTGSKNGSSLVFSLTVSDNQGGSHSDSVKVNILNTAPIANAGPDQTASVGDLVTLTANASSDLNDDVLSYLWSTPAGISLSDTKAQQPTFTINTGTKGGSKLVFNLTVSDNQGDSHTDSVEVGIVNSTPIANAGPDQNASVNDIVTLNATNSSDSNNDTLTYSWSAPAGISLSDTNARQPTFTLPTATKSGSILEFNLTVNDNQGGLGNDSVKITVLNTAPVANAGPDQNASVNDNVMLTAAGSSDLNNDNLTYVWAAPAGVSLSNNKAQQPTFTIATGTKSNTNLQFRLTVTDNQGESSTDSVTINVINTPPTANAGPDQNARVNDVVILNGSGSTDPNNDNLTYLWATTSGISLSNNNAAQPTFTVANGITVGETYIFDLTVDDGLGGTSADSVTISILNTPPFADAGPDQSVNVNDVVTLDARNSTDLNNDSLSYSWSGPAGITLTNQDSAQATFTAPLSSSTTTPITFSLTVNDGQGGSSTSSVNITILSSDPIANAGLDQNASVNDIVTLDASASSDPNNANLDYNWLAPDGITLSNPNAIQPTYTVAANTKAGLLFIFKLVVTNNQGGSDSDEVAITILNTAPIANAGPNQASILGSSVAFDGSASSDVNGDALGFSWSVLTSPNGSSATLVNPNSDKPTFTPDVLGSYTIELVVEDNAKSATDTLELSVVNFNVPEMIPITGGDFEMGDDTSPDGITQGEGNIAELPIHTVTVPDFELGKYEVTFTEYDQYLQSRTINPISDPSAITSGEAWDSGNWGRNSRPVVNVTWEDIQGYLNWLNTQLDIALDDPKRYRLPSGAEWEYAARAGQTSTFSTGDCMNTDQANYNGESGFDYIKANGESISCPATSIYRLQSEPVGSFAANAFGLFDMNGNVREWIADCWHDNYVNAPTDGSAWVGTNGGCPSRAVVRGGSWNYGLWYLRSSSRIGHYLYDRYNSNGFRLAKTR